MRYGQRGGYPPAEQQRREQLRLQPAWRFAAGDGTGEIARDLRVTPGLVRRWRRAWAEGGTAALKLKGPVSVERLSPQQLVAGPRGGCAHFGVHRAPHSAQQRARNCARAAQVPGTARLPDDPWAGRLVKLELWILAP